MPWIHRDDEVGLILWALDNASVSGTLNASAPNPVTNREFSKTLASVLRRPSLAARAQVRRGGDAGQELTDAILSLPARRPAPRARPGLRVPLAGARAGAARPAPALARAGLGPAHARRSSRGRAASRARRWPGTPRPRRRGRAGRRRGRSSRARGPSPPRPAPPASPSRAARVPKVRAPGRLGLGRHLVGALERGDQLDVAGAAARPAAGAASLVIGSEVPRGLGVQLADVGDRGRVLGRLPGVGRGADRVRAARVGSAALAPGPESSTTASTATPPASSPARGEGLARPSATARPSRASRSAERRAHVDRERRVAGASSSPPAAVAAATSAARSAATGDPLTRRRPRPRA